MLIMSQRMEHQTRKFSSTSGTGEYSELNESGEIVPWDEALKVDIDKVVKATHYHDDSERPRVGVVSDGHNGPVYAVCTWACNNHTNNAVCYSACHTNSVHSPIDY